MQWKQLNPLCYRKPRRWFTKRSAVFWDITQCI